MSALIVIMPCLGPFPSSKAAVYRSRCSSLAARRPTLWGEYTSPRVGLDIDLLGVETFLPGAVQPVALGW